MNDNNVNKEFDVKVRVANNTNTSEEILWSFIHNHPWLVLEENPEIQNFLNRFKQLLDKCKNKKFDAYEQLDNIYKACSDDPVRLNDRVLSETLSRVLDLLEMSAFDQEISKEKIDKIDNLLKIVLDDDKLMIVFVRDNHVLFLKLVQRYIKTVIDEEYKRFLDFYDLNEEECGYPVVTNLRVKDGSLIVFFNLVVSTGVHVYWVYKFASWIVENLSNRLAAEFGANYSIAASAAPANLAASNATPGTGTPTTAMSLMTNQKTFNRLLIIPIVALLLSIFSALFAAYSLYNASDARIRDIAKDESRQMIKKETPDIVKDIINQEKLEILFTDWIDKLPNDTIKGSDKKNQNK